MKNHSVVNEVIKNYKATKYDPNGSYTGVDVNDKNEQPTQDADDL